MTTEEEILSEHGVKPTANRILILRALQRAGAPLSMTELETELETVDKSIVFRTLVTFKAHHLLHQILSGEETRYELCRHDHEAEGNDEHVHFYCEVCHRTYCFEDIAVPSAQFPAGFSVSGVNYVASGVCPDCRKNK